MTSDLLELKRLLIHARQSFEERAPSHGVQSLNGAIRLLNEMLYKNVQEPLNAEPE